jgi:hypothetical protein
MKTSHLVAIICFAFTLSSCVQFKEAQPKQVENMMSFPNELLGKYTDSEQGTLTISEKNMTYVSKDGSKQFNKNLGEEFILRAFNGSYVINIKENENWQVFLTKTNGKDLDVYTVSLGNDDKKLTKLQKTIKVEVKQDPDGGESYVINPSKEEFQLLIDQSFFSKSNYFKRIK